MLSIHVAPSVGAFGSAALQSSLHKRSFCLSVSGWIAPSAEGAVTCATFPHSPVCGRTITRGAWRPQVPPRLVIASKVKIHRRGAEAKRSRRERQEIRKWHARPCAFCFLCALCASAVGVDFSKVQNPPQRSSMPRKAIGTVLLSAA